MDFGFNMFNMNIFGGFPSFMGGFNPTPVSAFGVIPTTYPGNYPLNPSLFMDGLGGVQNSSYMTPAYNSIFSNTQFTNPFNLSFNNVLNNSNPFNFSFNFESSFKPAEKSSKKGAYSKLSLSSATDVGLKFADNIKRDRWTLMDPEMQNKLVKLAEYAKSQGITITINSNVRTEGEQQRLIAQGRPAAKKGSKHLTGRAVDIAVSGDRNKNLALLGKYWRDELGGRWGGDFKHPKREPWHFDVG